MNIIWLNQDFPDFLMLITDHNSLFPNAFSSFVIFQHIHAPFNNNGTPDIALI